MRALVFLSTIGVLTGTLIACGDSRPAPEAFAEEALAAVATADFQRFWALNSHEEILVGKEGVSLPTDGLAGGVSPYTKLRAREDFDRVVRSGRINPGNVERLQPVVVATEPQRYLLEVFDASGVGIGVQLQIRKWNEGYRFLGLHAIPPGRVRESEEARG